MFYRSLFTNAFTACTLFSGEIALADSFNISNDDSSAYSLINSLGEPLNAGNAILGTFSSGTWSYDVTTSRWNFQGNSYAQDQLKYSDLMSMQNNFTSALTNIPEEQNGGVADGRFNLSGDYSSSLTSPVYLMALINSSVVLRMASTPSLAGLASGASVICSCKIVRRFMILAMSRRSFISGSTPSRI